MGSRCCSQIISLVVPHSHVLMPRVQLTHEYMVHTHACTCIVIRHVLQAVLINSGSASTSEAVAAALRDSGGAVLVGEPSFGKAKMQRAVPLHGGATLLLSNTIFLTPNHAPIDKACSCTSPTWRGVWRKFLLTKKG